MFSPIDFTLYKGLFCILNVRLTDSFDVTTGGSPPADRTKVVYELMSVSLPLFIFMAVVTSLAILISLFFLWFNIAKRNVR